MSSRRSLSGGTTIGTTLKKAILISVASGLLLIVFVADIIRRSVGSDIGLVTILRDAFIIAAFFIFTLLIESLWQREQGPSRKLGFALVLSLVVIVASGLNATGDVS